MTTKCVDIASRKIVYLLRKLVQKLKRESEEGARNLRKLCFTKVIY